MMAKHSLIAFEKQLDQKLDNGMMITSHPSYSINNTQEAGVIVNECTKLHTSEATKGHHSINFSDDKLQIPLQLHGTFLFFNHQIPTIDELQNLDVLHLTPDSVSWNPHSSHYSTEEDGMLDYEGNIIDNPT